MKKATFLAALAVMTGLFILTSCEKDNEEMTSVKDMTIAEYVSYDPNFSILLQALYKADLANVMQGEGNFTVFAPTNAAFSTLFSQLGVSGVADLSKETLTPILLYHVLGEEKKSASLSDSYLNSLSPAQNSYASMRISTAGGVKINKETNVVAADVDVKNGVIHAIDKVLLPPTVVDIALANESFSILVQAVVKAGLAETLSGTGPFTIFAPTNAAFEELFGKLGVSGINDLTAEQLIPVLTYHVVSGNVRSNQLSAGPVATLNGNIEVRLNPSPSINNTSNIVATDVQGSNGVIHVIDEVLLPAE
ncbi:MAG: fasciclin domain-containing protein [Methanosarcina sp.]|jgi:transforming growth factor-beta-induced protein|nr:fasciclin domain-containing protein [Methanosarcina sp.]